jgi:hypothetical protein
VLRWLGDTQGSGGRRRCTRQRSTTPTPSSGGLLTRSPQPRRGRTLIVVTADHGESLGEHGIYYAHTGSTSRSSTSLIVHAPGAAPAQRRAGPPLDIAPTLAELAGVPRPRVPGVSLAPLARARRAGPGSSSARAGAPERPQPGRRGERRRLEADLAASRTTCCSRALGALRLSEDPGETRDSRRASPSGVARPRAVERWIARGPLERGNLPHLDAEAVERLALGYLQD